MLKKSPCMYEVYSDHRRFVSVESFMIIINENLYNIVQEVRSIDFGVKIK